MKAFPNYRLLPVRPIYVWLFLVAYQIMLLHLHQILSDHRIRRCCPHDKAAASPRHPSHTSQSGYPPGLRPPSTPCGTETNHQILDLNVIISGLSYTMRRTTNGLSSVPKWMLINSWPILCQKSHNNILNMPPRFDIMIVTVTFPG